MKRYQVRIPGSIQKMRLDDYLQEWLSQALGEPLSKTKVRNLIMSGAVYVNRHRTKAPTISVYSGATIEVYYDPDKTELARVKWEDTRLKGEQVLFEDEWLIAMNKPAGLPTQPTVDPDRPNLFDLMKQFMVEREKNPHAYVGLHHRLDKDTSGIVLFTKKEEANVGVSKLFSEHGIEKTYQCLSWRSPFANPYEAQDEFKIENFLGKISAKNETSKFGAVQAGGDHAFTEFKVLDSYRDAFWLQAKPKTGRTHQIRIHCADQGLPILGDPLYFPKGMAPFIVAPRLMLHAAELTFIHPITGARILVECPLAEDFVRTLGQLRK